jgi:hypothetical protein
MRMSDQPENNQRQNGETQAGEYQKPQVEVLGRLQDLTEGTQEPGTDIGVTGSVG